MFVKSEGDGFVDRLYIEVYRVFMLIGGDWGFVGDGVEESSSMEEG